MLTVNSEELDHIDYIGFLQDEITEIRETFVLFQHFSFTEYTPDGACVRICGSIFEKPKYTYHVIKTRCGIRVEVSSFKNYFAINFYKEQEGQMQYSVHRLSM